MILIAVEVVWQTRFCFNDGHLVPAIAFVIKTDLLLVYQFMPSAIKKVRAAGKA